MTRRLSVLRDGVIVPPSHMELVVVDQCNVACRSCNHGSPGLGRYFVTPESVARDCSVLARWYRPPYVKVLGGEPLLHKNLAEVVQAARGTGISDRFRLVTNGMLLGRAPETLWEAIDEVEVSAYPGFSKTEENLPLARDLAERHGVKLSVARFENFRHTMTTVGTRDAELAQNVYSACKIANVWGCHTVRDGFFYKCPQSMHLRDLVPDLAEEDRLALEDSSDFQARLLEFVNSPSALSACSFCLGTVGKLHPHGVLERRAWGADLERPSEELVDHAWLQRCLMEQDPFDDCQSIERPRSLLGRIRDRLRGGRRAGRRVL